MNDLLPWSIPPGFLPHGQCLLWESGLIWLHMIADSAVVLAYYSIPFILANFVRKREDLSFGWMLHLVQCIYLRVRDHPSDGHMDSMATGLLR